MKTAFRRQRKSRGLARTKAKALAYKPVSYALIVALLMILAAMPWPFREIVGRPWFPGM